MKARCYTKKCNDYQWYGKRGIKICPEWLDSFYSFVDDMYEEYLKHVEKYGKKNTSLERIDNNGNYTPENCKWATWVEQLNNQRPKIEFKSFKVKLGDG